MLNVVLIISAGNDTKLPNGNFLIALIASGTLLYVGYVFLIYHAAASFIASSYVFNLLVNKSLAIKSCPCISGNHFLSAFKSLYVFFNCDCTYSSPNHFQTLSPPA